MVVEDRATHPRLVKRGEKKALPEHERFTEAAQQRRLSRSNVMFYPRSIDFNEQASRDAIRHFVDGFGDTNPLFRDPKYAAKTKYGRLIAPGSFLYSVQWGSPGGFAPGVHAWYTGGQWEYFRPIFVDDTFVTVCCRRQLETKEGKMGGGRTWLDHFEVIYLNQRREIVGVEHGWAGLAERGAAGSTGKNRSQEKPQWTTEDWERILEAYDKEIKERRGANPRYWEDVEVGEPVGPMIKGPLSVRDEIAWLMGAGTKFMRAHGIQYDYERRHPKCLEYVEEIGEADVPELVHIFDAYARTIGVERAYDYGCQRQTWLHNLFTNWMGDEGFLWKMRGDLRAFNQIGDVTTFEGKVTRKYIDGEKFCVDIEASAKNQRGQWSMLPNPATVILPSCEYGPVVYPIAPTKLYQEVAEARPLEEIIKEAVE